MRSETNLLKSITSHPIDDFLKLIKIFHKSCITDTKKEWMHSIEKQWSEDHIEKQSSEDHIEKQWSEDHIRKQWSKYHITKKNDLYDSSSNSTPAPKYNEAPLYFDIVAQCQNKCYSICCDPYFLTQRICIFVQKSVQKYTQRRRHPLFPPTSFTPLTQSHLVTRWK